MKTLISFLIIPGFILAISSCIRNEPPPVNDQSPIEEPQPVSEDIPTNSVYGIDGPGWLYSGTPGHYKVQSSSPEGIEYQFSVQPPDAGTFEPGRGIFTPADVFETTEITITLDYTLDNRPGSYSLTVQIFPKRDGWARKWGITRIKDIFGPTVDSTGNLYVTGIFDQRCDFDPDLLSTDEHESVRFTDCFLSKFTQDGDVVWTSTWGGFDSDAVIGLATDSAGNSYVAGPATGLIFFGPVEDSTGYDVEGGTGGYLARFSSDGEFQWVKMWGSVTGAIDVTTVAVDNAGNPYAAGSFAGDADFRPGDEIVGGVSRGYADAFISKFTSGGNHVWTTSWGGSDPQFDICQPNTLAFDGASNVYAVGIFQGEMEFGPSRGFGGRENVHRSNGASDIFLIKLKNDGFTDWEKVWGGEFTDYGIGLLASSRGLYVTGSFTGVVDFDPGRGVREFESESVNDYYFSSTFLARYSYSGQLGWVTNWGDGAGFALAEDNPGNILVTGYANGSLVIGEGDEHEEIRGSAFLAEFGSGGDYIWGRAWGKSDDETGSGVVAGRDGNIYVAGMSSGDVYWDPDDGFTYVSTIENPSAFLIKFLPDGSW